MPGDPFFVIGLAASAGGLEALMKIVSGLPAEFPACLLTVRHRTMEAIDLLPDLLQTRTRLPVKQAEDGDPIAPGTVYTAQPGWHLMVSPEGTLRLSDAPKVKHVRPAADVLFRSMAASLGQWAVAVVLTGYDGDGSGGLADIRAGGGRVIVQDPETASVPEMPISALQTGQVDLIVPLNSIASVLAGVVSAATTISNRPRERTSK